MYGAPASPADADERMDNIFIERLWRSLAFAFLLGMSAVVGTTGDVTSIRRTLSIHANVL